MDLRSYTLEELEKYLTPLFSTPGSTVPLSPLRLQSYLTNPRADAKDVVLFEMIDNNQVVGYRTLLPDLYFDHKGVPQGFAWLSGNWVHPEKRRMGISTLLLQEAEKKWDSRLMYTNYAPDSKALYDNTGHFPIIAKREGRRYYLRSNSEELLGKRMKAPALLRIGDQLINQMREQNLKTLPLPEHEKISVKAINKPGEELTELISRVQQKSLFRRDLTIINWALDQPWVSVKKTEKLDYQFSYGATSFENLLFEFRHQDSGSAGLLWLIEHNRTMTVPYLFSEDSEITAAMVSTLLKTMIEKGCTHTTIRLAELNQELNAYRKLFLTSKEMPQYIFAHKTLADSIPGSAILHDGDGDVLFTG